MKQVVIWDDFYADPMTLRQVALETEYEEPGQGNYPGRNSILKFFPEEMKEFFSYIAGEPIKPVETSNCGGFRIQHKDETGKQYIHVDLPSMTTTWAGICYLSLPEHYENVNAGSMFWKHKETGMEQMPFSKEYLSTIGINNPNDLFKFMNTEGTDTSKWINTFSIPIKFNRLIMFRSNLWHSQGELFGNTKENSRLIQTFFFEPDVK